MRAIGLVLALTWPAVLTAQDVPGTDLYLASMTRYQCPIQFGEPVNITDRPGYDNQPAFTPDGLSILYTSIRDDGQADTYRYHLGTDAIVRITATPESEYSPTVLPSEDGFSTVRVERDSTQRLWAFALDGSSPRLLLPDVAPVGYHAWGDAHRVALFVLGDPPTLRLADLETGETRTVARDVGRSLHKVPRRHAVSFLHRESNGERWIKELDLETNELRRLIPPVGDGEDYAFNALDELLMADGSVLYGATCGVSAEWERLADFSEHGITNITRLAVSPDGRWLVMVADDGRTVGR